MSVNFNFVSFQLEKLNVYLMDIMCSKRHTVVASSFEQHHGRPSTED